MARVERVAWHAAAWGAYVTGEDSGCGPRAWHRREEEGRGGLWCSVCTWRLGRGSSGEGWYASSSLVVIEFFAGLTAGAIVQARNPRLLGQACVYVRTGCLVLL